MKGETGKQQRTKEGIDGGLHPAVDGQSLGERRKTKAGVQNRMHSHGDISRWKLQVKPESNVGQSFEQTPWLEGNAVQVSE